MITDIFEPDAIDFYDWNELDKLQEKRAKKYIQLCMQIETGNFKAKATLKKHIAETRILKARAKATGYYWA